MTAPLIGIERHRIDTDGRGVTTLVAFHGCTLRCRYCLNPQCLDSSMACRIVTPQELKEEVSIDSLYFAATGGGVTFGGGEPLMRSGFIREFCECAEPEWMISIETALNVSTEHLEEVLPYADHYFVDVKDMDCGIYRSYTARSNALVKENLKLLARHVPQEKITIRLPLIQGYNSEEQRAESRRTLEEMGFCNFDLFSYIKKEHQDKEGRYE